MRQTILLLLLLACVLFASAGWIKNRSEEDEDWEGDATINDPSDITIKHHDDGNWSFGYRTSNNIEVYEESENTDIVKGEYSYVDPDGRLVKVSYIAGAGIGFVPYSNVIDDAIMKSIELNLKNPPQNYDSNEEGVERKPVRDYSYPTFSPKPRRVPEVVKSVDKGFDTVQKVKTTTVRNLNRLRKIQPKVVEESKVTVDNENVENVETPKELVNENVENVENVKIEPTDFDQTKSVEDEVKVSVDDLKSEESVNDAIAKNLDTVKTVKEAVKENINRARKIQSKVSIEAKKSIEKVSEEEKVVPEESNVKDDVVDEEKIMENVDKVEKMIEENLRAVKKVKEEVVQDSHRFGGIRRKIAEQVKVVDEENGVNMEATTMEDTEENKKIDEPTTVIIPEVVSQKPSRRKSNRLRKVQSTPTSTSETDLNITQNVQNAIENRLNTANNLAKAVVENVRHTNRRRRVRPTVTTTTQPEVTTTTQPTVITTNQPAETTTAQLAETTTNIPITEPVTDVIDIILENIKTAEEVKNAVVKNLRKFKKIPQVITEEVSEVPVEEKSGNCNEKYEVKTIDPCEQEKIAETTDSVTTTEESTTTVENMTTLLEVDTTEPTDVVSTTETASSSTSPIYFRSRGKFRNRNL